MCTNWKLESTLRANECANRKMRRLDLETTVPDWLIEYPQLLKKLEELGIDYCCGGKSLEFACREQGLDPQLVLARITAFLDQLDTGII
jgi:iron-sulfur cluster repair protein YtfE (RIC family)